MLHNDLSFTYQTNIIYISNKHHLHIKQTHLHISNKHIYMSNKHHLHIKQTHLHVKQTHLHVKQTSFTYQTNTFTILHVKQTSFTYQTNIIYISSKHHLHIKQTSASQERSEICKICKRQSLTFQNLFENERVSVELNFSPHGHFNNKQIILISCYINNDFMFKSFKYFSKIPFDIHLVSSRLWLPNRLATIV